MKIVCIGDSLTYGYGIRRSKTWIRLSMDKLNIEIINEGINGDTTGGMLSRFYNSVFSYKPDKVFIMGGSNDLIAGAGLGIIKANIMSMVHQSLSKYIVPIIGIPPKIDLDYIRSDWASITEFNKIAEDLESYYLWIKDFSKAFNIKYVDFYTDIEKKAGEDIHNIYIDGLHLNEKGQAIMAEIFCDSIK